MNKIIFFLAILLLFSCTSNTIYKAPKDLIPKDTMVALISDMIIATSAKLRKNIELERNVNYMPLVYEKYKIDSTRFKESNIYYLSKIDAYEEIFKEVQHKLKGIQQKYRKEKRIKDSILKLERKKRTEKLPKNKNQKPDSVRLLKEKLKMKLLKKKIY